MNVTAKFPADMDARTQYKMLKSPKVKRMSDAIDSMIEVKSWISYSDADPNTGEEREVLVIEAQDGEIFATVSATFRREFAEIVKFFGEDVGAIIVLGGKSKAGRNYITCTVE